MSLFQRPIQRKLSAVLGARVTFERLAVSLVGGTLDGEGMAVTANAAGRPLLTVKRVLAEVALTKALSGEIVVKSLTLERPVLNVERLADGSFNLPRGPAESLPADSDAGRQCDDGDHQHLSRGWTFEVRKVLVVDGEVHYRDETLGGPGRGAAYRVSAGPVLAEVAHPPDGDAAELTLIVDFVTAGGERSPVAVGDVRAIGRLTNLANLAAWRHASASLAVDLGHSMRVRLEIPRLCSGVVRAEVNGTVDLHALPLAAFAPLLPAVVAGLLNATAFQGRVELSGRAEHAPGRGLSVQELTVRAADVAITGNGAADAREGNGHAAGHATRFPALGEPSASL